MLAEKQIRFWVVGFLLFALALYFLRGVLLPFVLGMAIAYLLDPLCDRLEALKIRRWLGTTVTMVGFFLACLLVFMLLVPVFVSQVGDLLERAPSYIAQAKGALERLLIFVEARADAALMAKVEEALKGLSDDLVGWITTALRGVLSRGAALVDFLSLIVITPVVAFYLLRDWDKINATVDGWLPRRHLEVLRRLAAEVDETLSGFIRGQGTVCLLLGAFYAVGLTVAGLEFGLVVGLVSGILTFIPYAGSIFGLILSVGLALTQFDSLTRVAVVAVIFVVGQLLEGNVLTPKLVGDKVGLHPVWIIFALLAGGALFGFVGILIAVPLAAVIGVGVRFGLGNYLASHYYDDSALDPSDAAGEAAEKDDGG